jgi:hypothetical protein
MNLHEKDFFNSERVSGFTSTKDLNTDLYKKRVVGGGGGVISLNTKTVLLFASIPDGALLHLIIEQYVPYIPLVCLYIYSI